jgi:predicted DCC family thiol-disulfide oxidoreductase YuxK
MSDVSRASFTSDPVPHPILLYDGVCGLCNRLNQFVLRHDPEGLFRFASLQSLLAEHILTRHDASARDLDTVYVVLNYNQPNESLYLRSDAAMFVLKRLGGIWRPAGILMGWLPRWFRDWTYNVVARNRYRVFGRYETCMLPSPETRSRFLDV